MRTLIVGAGATGGYLGSRLIAAGRNLNVDDVTAGVSEDIVEAMWAKFAFITAMTVLTCLMRATIGPIARTPGGIELAHTVLAEVSNVAAASGHPLSHATHNDLRHKLTAADSTFGPSMYRDMKAGRPVETDVLAEMCDHARRHGISAPLLDAGLVALQLHNSGLAAADTH